MKRTTSRIVAAMILYNYDINNNLDYQGVKEIIDEDLKFQEDITYDDAFAEELVMGVIAHQKEIDHIISINLKNYTLDRLNYVDRNLIRIGVYEMMNSNIPTSIIINEIIEIAKEYSEIEGYESSKFNNALLDKIARDLSNGK